MERFKIRWNWKREAAMLRKEREHGSKKEAWRQMRREMGKTEQEHRGTKRAEKYKKGWRGTERGEERDMEG
jgi:hypothetical protein